MHFERALVFACEGEHMVGVVALPTVDSDAVVSASMAKVGVLVVVGGPQYRVGSHRQFVHLARFLADEGIPCMRFDYRGMGDATGAARDFQDVTPDIDAAVEVFVREAPGVERVVLWGLCDGASAICFSLGANARVCGAVLLNPWVRTAATEARTMLKHYYLRRVFDKQFWLKLIRGGVSVRKALGGVSAAAGQATQRAGRTGRLDAGHSVPGRMLKGLAAQEVPFAVFLSGRDYVAREFEQRIESDAAWAALIASPRCSLRHFEQADHTFSSAASSEAAAMATLEWVRGIA